MTPQEAIAATHAAQRYNEWRESVEFRGGDRHDVTRWDVAISPTWPACYRGLHVGDEL